MTLSNLLPRIFKSTKRYSGASKPSIGKKVFFSPAVNLTVTELVPMTTYHELLGRPHVVQNAPVIVLDNRENLTEVQFPNATETDFVPPEFLCDRELTSFGEAFLGSASKLSPQNQRILLGEM